MSYTHAQVCEEYNKVKNTVTDTIHHQQMRLAFVSNPNYRAVQMGHGNGNIRAFLNWFVLPSIFSVIVAYFLAGAM